MALGSRGGVAGANRGNGRSGQARKVTTEVLSEAGVELNQTAGVISLSASKGK